MLTLYDHLVYKFSFGSLLFKCQICRKKKFYNSIKYGNIVIISNNQFQVTKTASVLYACKYVILNKSCNLRHTMLP
ncbi:hypothetical protein HanXRQr2_Chr11g0504281 [Helianthus annuus]|uniref:Uncharacterized protein n=1 Tax=Helianthus annuus TaxID=4232 RepID=A0A9K3N162_HELAN|nr:hypothetical protein HanXRQr2_Chr11g0504281 [Helianthus annuus]